MKKNTDKQIKDFINDSISKEIKEAIKELKRAKNWIDGEREFIRSLDDSKYACRDDVIELLGEYRSHIMEIYECLKEDVVIGSFDIKLKDEEA